MQQKLQNQFNYLETNLNQLFSDLGNYSHQQLNQQPTPDSWSPIQVLHHLMLSERYSVAYCEKKLSFQPKLKKAGLTSAVRTKFVGWYLNSPFKFKALPKISGDNLPTEDSLENIRNIWEKQRKAMHQFLDAVPAEYADKEVYKHPFGGRLSIFGMMQFFDSHFRTHRKQIFRALK